MRVLRYINLERNTKLIFNTIDGKICSSVTDTSSAQVCHVYDDLSKQINDIDTVINREIIKDTFRFRLTTLYGWTCFFLLAFAAYLVLFGHKIMTNSWAPSKVEKKMCEKQRWV